MKYNIKYIITISLFILLGISNLKGQTLPGDLGVVWKKKDFTTSTSYFLSICKQTDGTYLAVGNIIPADRELGYVVHFNEAGEKLNEWILTPPSVAQWTEGGNKAISIINKAYITSTGDLMAFGIIKNIASTNKGHSLAGTVDALNDHLKEGIWVTRASYSGNILVNQVDRGNSSLADVIEYKTDKYLMTGFDYQSNHLKNFLFRIYDTNGGWVYDNYSGGNGLDYDWANTIHKLPNSNNLLITSAFEVREYRGDNFQYVKSYATALQWGEGCVEKSPIQSTLPNEYWTLL